MQAAAAMNVTFCPVGDSKGHKSTTRKDTASVQMYFICRQFNPVVSKCYVEQFE